MIEQRSEEWHAQRLNRITGSNVGAILGHDPYRTRDDVMRAMVRASHGAPAEFTGNAATDWGTAMETQARMAYEFETGNEVEDAPFVPFEDWAGASPDGYIGPYGLLEIKAPYFIRQMDPPSFKRIEEQPHYHDQMQFQMVCTGRLWCDFWQWTPHGHSLCRIMPDPAWRADNMPILRQFYASFLWERYNNANEHLAPLRITIDTPEATKMVAEWDELVEQAERVAERKKDLLDSMVSMAGGKNATFGGRKLTLTQRAGSISYGKAIKELLPDADLSKWQGKASESWGFK